MIPRERKAREWRASVIMARALSKLERQKAIDENVGKKTKKPKTSGGIVIENEQLGKKIRKHAPDWGLDPKSQQDRNEFAEITSDIIENKEFIVSGFWRGQTGYCDFYVKGDDVVITNDGKYVSTLKDGVHNPTIAKYIKEKGVT